MALGALGRTFGRKHLEAALGQKLPTFPFRDWSWRWWNVLHLSGLGEHWEDFKDAAQEHGLRMADRVIRHRVTPEQYLEFRRRAGTTLRGYSRNNRKGDVIWTKGGTWRIESPMTQLLVLKQHLPERPITKRWQHRLGQDGIHMVERELMRLVDPDAILMPDAKHRAVAYVRRRFGELLRYKRNASYAAACWFFNCPIPYQEHWLVPRDGGRYIQKVYQPPRANDWTW